MGDRRQEIRTLAALALPIIATNLGTMLIGLVDTLMVARVSKDALAAATLGNVWINGTLLFAMGVVFGMDPIVSQAHGSGDGERVGRALHHGSIVAVGAAALLGLLWTLTEPFLVAAGQDPALAREADLYVRVQIPTVPLFMAFVALRQYLQGRGILRPTLWVIFGANVLNAIFNAWLIFGGPGIRPLGLLGAGIASAATRAAMFLGLLLLARRLRLFDGAWAPWSRRSFSFAGLREVLRYGLPVGLQFSLEVWAFAAATLMAGRLGTVAVAAHAIALNMASLSFMVPMGISFAAVTRVGNLVGAGRLRDAQRSAWIAFAMGAAVMAMAGLVFAGLRGWLPTLYTREAEVVAACAAILPIAAAFQVFDGVQVVGAGILRGTGATLPAACFNLVGYWVLALPLAWWMAFERGWALAGVWWGLALGLAIVAVSLVAWVHRRGPAGPLANRPVGAA